MKGSNQHIQDDLLMEKLSQIVLDNLGNPQFGVETLAEAVGMSRSHLHRQLKRIKGQSVSQFIRTLRLEKALEMIQQDETQINISDIAYLVGFNSTSYFNKCFREKYGFSPKEARDLPAIKIDAPSLKAKIAPTSRSDKMELRFRAMYRVVALGILIIFLTLAGYYMWHKQKALPAKEESIAALTVNKPMTLQGLMEENIDREKITTLAIKALEEDGNLAEAYKAMASIYSNEDYDQDAAEQAFLRVIELNPSYTMAYQFYAEHLSVTGRYDEARIYMNQALELDSGSFIIRYVSAKLYYNQGDFEKALNEIQICYKLYKRQFRLDKDLFQTDDVLKVAIQTNWKHLLYDRGEHPNYHSAKLNYLDEENNMVSLPIELRVRGNFRRRKNNCAFPPLKLRFDSVAVAPTIFAGQDQLKLVTHCQSKEEVYEQYLLEEYFIYKMYNQLTDASFRVRLLEISFISEGQTTDSLVRYAFLIENKEDLARRLGGKIVEVPNIQPEQLEAETINKLAVFQYFIGNTDWSIPNLHNIVLIGRDSSESLRPIPYDFDFSGLVNPHYAQHNKTLDLETVTQRIFKGVYTTEEALEKNLQQFRNQKTSFQSIINSPDLLEEKQKQLAQIYMDQFYSTINNPEKVKLEFTK